MALYRLVCALGHQGLVTVLTQCGLPVPPSFLADEKHSRCLTEKVSLPTMVQGQVLGHLGYTTEASAAALTQSYGAFQRAALQQEPTYRVRGVLTDGFDSPTKSLRMLCPEARLGFCLRHAPPQAAEETGSDRVPGPSGTAHAAPHPGVPSPPAQEFARVAWASGYARFVDHVPTTAGAANGERVRRWFQDKKAGWYAVLTDPQMPVTSTLLAQAHNTIERKLFAMKGFHHPGGVSRRFSGGWPACTTWSRINVAPSRPGNVGWRWKAGEYQHATGSSMSTSSPTEGFAER